MVDRDKKPMKQTPDAVRAGDPKRSHDAGREEDPENLGRDLPLPHERDGSTGHVAATPDPKIQQAKEDLDSGQVDTDMWGTAGLDHDRKKRLVPDTKPKG